MTEDSEERGRRIRQRREDLGMDIKELAELVPMDRGQLSRIEKGASTRATTLSAIERALDRIDTETSGPYDERGGMVTYRLQGNFGVDVTLEGPVANLAELEASVARLISQMQDQGKS